MAPPTTAWTVIASYALLPWLGLYEPADEFVRRGLSAALLAASAYVGLRLFETPVWPAAVIAALLGFSLRAGALAWGWSLPGFPDARPR